MAAKGAIFDEEMFAAATKELSAGEEERLRRRFEERKPAELDRAEES
ncbi:MAG: hypothetical protein ACFBQW_00900 [Sphingomonadaceae bacterium]